jgi:glutathione synthase
VQVELNTIASSFACLSSLTSRMHGALLHRINSGGAGSGAAGALRADQLPANPAMEALPAALAAAVRATGLEGAVMVMVVQPGERNAYDQQVGWARTPAPWVGRG